MAVRIVLITGRLLLVAALLAAITSACGDGQTTSSSGRLRIVAAFYPVAEAARRAGGDAVDVTNVTAAGTEPHDLELTTKQVDEIEDADLVLYVGGGFQPAIEEIAKRQGDAAIDLAPASGGDDPHFWLDPRTFAVAVARVGEAIADAVPAAQREEVQARTAAYVEEIGALDREMGAGLATCERRSFVTTHAAFGRLAARYDLEQLAISGLSPESEPSASRLDELADLIEEQGITTVFYEELVSPDVARTVARETGASVDLLSPIEGLTPAQEKAGKTYADLMRANLAALRKALACS